MAEIKVGNKVIIVGCPGSGKSTLAVKLADITGLPLIHLDNIWWNADRTHISREEFDSKLQEIMQGDEWILDGDYSRTYEERIRVCDTVIMLDYGKELCMVGITERVGKEREDIPWTEQKLDPELARIVRKFHKTNRSTLMRLFKKYPDTQVIVFKTRAEADAWLSELSENQKETL